MKKFLLNLIKIYQKTLYPLFLSSGKSILPADCRFWPTCSVYTQEAISARGVWRGLLLSLKRVSRCHPWSVGGIDLVK